MAKARGSGAGRRTFGVGGAPGGAGEARRRAEAGSIIGAAEALANSPVHDPERGAMAEAIERQARRAADALAAAVAALDRDDLHTASSQIRMAKKLHTKLDGLSKAEDQLVRSAVRRAAGSFEAGRLDRAKQDLALLAELECRQADRMEIEVQVRQAVEAANAFAAHDYAQTALLLGRLAKMNPRAEWIVEARKQLDAIEVASESVLEGPLGLLAHQNHGAKHPADEKQAGGGLGDTLPALAAAHVKAPPIARAMKADAPGFAPPPPPATPGLPRRVMIRIDGVGSFLLVRGDRVSIGRAGPGATADVQLVSDLSEKQAEIVRAGEDYFVVSQSGVELAGANIDHALLQNADRIRLGKRVRLKFLRPSLKSSTALLELGEGVRMETDCRKVILWSGPVLIGGTRECHIPALQGRGEFVLMERGGRLYVKEMGPAGQRGRSNSAFRRRRAICGLRPQPWVIRRVSGAWLVELKWRATEIGRRQRCGTGY
ncbi:MAG: FHA domain-containing protein [Planctomycetes bacterium]|nr:FHA domain-containing protein [Planctomycetota bacterium]